MVIIDITIPAVAMPLPPFFLPTIPRISPTIPIGPPRIGIHQNTRPIIPSTIDAIDIPFFSSIGGIGGIFGLPC